MNYEYIVPHLISNMTPRAFRYLKDTLLLIKTLSQFQSVNGLDLKTLLILFAPILCKPKSAAFMCIKHSNAISDIVDLLYYIVTYYDYFFDVFKLFIYLFNRNLIPQKHHKQLNS